jgi:cell division protein FtsA
VSFAFRWQNQGKDCVKYYFEGEKLPLTREEIVVGLDIGTTKVCTVIGQGSVSTGAPGEETGPINIIGVGVVPSRGIKKGVVVDVEDTVAAIRDSVERAAHMAGVKVEGAVAGVTGDHIQSSNRRGTVTVSSPQNIVSRFDVERVLQAAALEIPRDREIIHSLPRDFVVDGHPGVKRPIGMAGQRLEVETHVVTGKGSFLQNAVQCVERAGLNVEALVLEPIATAEAVTTADERDMGVILIDIGGGTSDIAVFIDGSIIYSSVLPVGGNHVTRDIAIGLRTPFEIAEKLKIESGAAMQGLIPHGEALEVLMAGSGERLRIPRVLLGEIIEARMSELFELSREAMVTAGVKRRLPGGIIISGGGALLPGALDLASEIFQMPVRLGRPIETIGWSDQVSTPQFATGVGLCRFALQQRYAPSNQAAIPSIASTEGRRVWGAIASTQLIPPPGVYSEAEEDQFYYPEPEAAAPITPEPAPAQPVIEKTLFDGMAPQAISAANTSSGNNFGGTASSGNALGGSTPSSAETIGANSNPLSAPTKTAPPGQPMTSQVPPLGAPRTAPPAANRGADIRSEMLRREEPSDEEGEKLTWWQKLLAKLREIIGFEAP